MLTTWEPTGIPIYKAAFMCNRIHDRSLPAVFYLPHPSHTSIMSRFFIQPPPPKTQLGRHRQLAPLAGMHVSPLCLGAMSVGDKWEKIGFGAMDKAASFKLLDAFYEAGGNFIDTANNYQDESSEEFIGEWMEQRGVRDQMVIATKVRAVCSIVGRGTVILIRWQYSTNYKRGSGIPQQTHYVGNNIKSLHMSVAASLKKLRTDYVDILYVHWVKH